VSLLSSWLRAVSLNVRPSQKRPIKAVLSRREQPRRPRNTSHTGAKHACVLWPADDKGTQPRLILKWRCRRHLVLNSTWHQLHVTSAFVRRSAMVKGPVRFQ
jgi:hypothetical protein